MDDEQFRWMSGRVILEQDMGWSGPITAYEVMEGVDEKWAGWNCVRSVREGKRRDTYHYRYTI